MRLNSFYPVLLTDDVAASAAFFLEHLGFRETFRNEWYVSLVHGDREEYELAFVQRTHESVPAGYRAASNVLLNVEVEDAAREYERLRPALDVVVPLRDEAWGQRHFIGALPGGVLLDVIEVIEPSAEYAAQYVGGEGSA